MTRHREESPPELTDHGEQEPSPISVGLSYPEAAPPLAAFGIGDRGLAKAPTQPSARSAFSTSSFVGGTASANGSSNAAANAKVNVNVNVNMNAARGPHSDADANSASQPQPQPPPPPQPQPHPRSRNGTSPRGQVLRPGQGAFRPAPAALAETRTVQGESKADFLGAGAAMQSPHILVIDDSLTIRKMVECHLSQAGYRVSLAPDAERGLHLAIQSHPDLVLLDHQLPGATGDDVCRKLLANPASSDIPVLVSSSIRNRAAALYADFYNVIEYLHKPFTPDALKSGVANALKHGPAILKSQRDGDAMPEMEGVPDALLQGLLQVFPTRSILDFINNSKQNGRLTITPPDGRQMRFALSSGRIQAAYSAMVDPRKIEPYLPGDLADLAPLLAVTLAEQQDPQMGGLVNILQKSLSDPRRLRMLLRAQAAVLTHWALTATEGTFAFEPQDSLPPMFQAFPLQTSLPALAVEGVRRCAAPSDAETLASLVFARQTKPGANLDRAGLSPAEMKIHTLFDGNLPLSAIAQTMGIELADVVAVALGLELTGLVERRVALASASVLVLEEDAETVRAIQRAIGPEGFGFQLKVVRDRVGAQLLLRRNKFDIVIMGLDTSDQETFLKTTKEICPQARFIGIVRMHDEGESELARLDSMGLDAVLHRPVTEADLIPTIKHVLGSRGPSDSHSSNANANAASPMSALASAR